MTAANLLTGVVGMLLLAACGSDGEGTEAPPASGGALTDAIGRTFVSTGVAVDGKPHALVTGSQVRLTFQKDSVNADAGCNLLSGAFQLRGDRLEVGALAGTEMGCEPALMQQDQWLAGLLTSSPTIAASGDRLTLTAGQTVLSMVDEQSVTSDRSMRGTLWVLDSYGGSGPDATVGSSRD